MNNWSIRHRILFLSLVPSAILAMLLSGLFLYTNYFDHQAAFNHKGNTFLQLLLPTAVKALSSSDNHWFLSLSKQLQEENELVSITLTDTSGKKLLEVNNPNYDMLTLPTTHVFRSPVTNKEPIDVDIDSSKNNKKQPIQYAERTLGWLLIKFSNDKFIASQRTLLYFSILCSLTVIFFALFVGLHISGGIRKPIVELSKALQTVGKGNLRFRAHENSGAEIGELEKSLNTMLAAVSVLQEHLNNRINGVQTELENVNLWHQLHDQQNKKLDNTHPVKLTELDPDFFVNVIQMIRGRINGILGVTNLLCKSNMNGAQLSRVRVIDTYANALCKTINDLQDFTHIQNNDLSIQAINFNLKDIIETTLIYLAPLAYDKGLNFANIFYSDVPKMLTGDPVRIRQVLANIVDNAIKYTIKGSVVVRVMLETETEQDATIKISIQDTGIGIGSKTKPNLFTVPNGTDPKGRISAGRTGLSLPMSKILTSFMSGDIGVESEPGSGSNFWFTFTCKKQELEENDNQQNTELEACRCLVYDNHEKSRLALIHLLSEWEMDITEVSDRDKILETVHKARLSRRPFELIILCLNKQELSSRYFEGLHSQFEFKNASAFILLISSNNLTIVDDLYNQGAHLCFPRIVRQDELYLGLSTALRAVRDEQGTAKFHPQQTKNTRIVATFHPTIMVVDDNKMSRSLLTSRLNQQGMETVEAINGEQAIEFYSSRQFDLIMLNTQMQSMDGTETARQIRSLEIGRTRTPIIALTSTILHGDRDQLGRAGFDDYIVKPIRDKDFWDVAIKWIDTDKYATIIPRSYVTKSKLGESPSKSAILGNETNKSNTATLRSIRPRKKIKSNMVDRKLATRIAGGNAALAEELFSMLLDELPELKRKLNIAFQQNDLKTLETESHKIHGSASYCAVQTLKISAEQLEKASSKKILNRISPLLEQLNQDIDSLLDEHSL